MVIARRIVFVSLLLFLLFGGVFVSAHIEEEEVLHEESGKAQAFEDRGMTLKLQALRVIVGAAVISGALALVAIVYDKKKKARTRWVLFLGITIPVILATLYSAATTVYVNRMSATAGPVHWHADFEMWKCGEKIDLKDPTGVTNRIGTPVFHEHGDDRLHVEGVILDLDDAALHHFFEFVGGDMTTSTLLVPTNEGFVRAENGELCDRQAGKLQMFVVEVVNPDERDDWRYRQHKVEDFTDYVLAPYSQVPPGDCIIVEFDVEKERTEHLCSTYRLAIERGELHGS